MEFVNDIGKPWQYEEDGFSVIRTSMWSPPGCHPVGCGLKLYVKDGVLDHVEGDENNPVTKGRLCPRCLALKDYVYNPSRVIYPMKRDPKDRGKADKWERISWDEAFAMIKEKRDYFAETYGPECMAVLSGTGRSGGIMVSDMAQAVLGTPNACYTQSGYACYQPRSAACSHVLGAYYPEIDYAGGLEGTYDNPVFVVPETIVVWGKEPLPSNGDGLWGHAVIDLMKRGAKLISVDPRVNWLSTRAAVHLRVRPGTDTAMAMAWLWVIINEDLYDHDFVEYWCYGFDEFKARINDPEKGITPEKAAEICEVPVEDIYKAARLYASSKPASIAWGLALDQNQNGNQAGHCLLSLMAITGNIDVPGGQIIAEIDAAPGVGEDGAPIEMEVNLDKADASADGTAAEDAARPTRRIGWDSLSEELKEKTIGMKEYPMYVNNIRNAHADMMFDAVTTGKPYPIRMVWIQSTNLLAPTCSAESDKWYQGLLNCEFNFATDLFMTPSVEGLCDLILPLASCAEKDDVVMTHYFGSPVTIGAINKAVDVGEVKSDVQIMIELGEYLGSKSLHGLFKDAADFLDQRRANVAKMSWSQLAERVIFQRGVNYRKYESGKLRPDRKPGFLTPTGRVELWSTAFAANGEDPLPYYSEPAFSPHSSPELMEKYPFILTTGARVSAYFHSEHRQIPVLRELNPDALIEINPEDAAELGVASGQWVEIANDFGQAKFKAVISPIVKPGTVQCQHGWWFPEQDGDAPNLYGVFQSNCNTLIANHYNSKLGYGAPYKANICSVKPLKESYDTDMNLVH
ncbi:MAG: molybdopterin-dependent oxidoreductase, partial [Coriobacteriaceae bacterium]|nr:molybdopterin-dependent oxidoreductase [Coriobacteriaceae bacterium]